MVDTEIIKGRLEEELEKLKAKYEFGHDLRLVYLPNEKRINDFGNKMEGEIQNNNLLIYTSDPEYSLKVLQHEFIEYMIDIHTSPYLDLINSERKVIARMLYVLREQLVDKLTKNM